MGRLPKEDRSTHDRNRNQVRPVSLSAVEADGTFTGYASLFNSADLGRDMVMPGAFRASLGKRGAGGVKMLFQHDPSSRSACGSTSARTAQGLP